MPSIVKRVALVLAVLAAVLAAIVALQPSEYAIERSAEIRAPASVVIGHIANVRAWEAWSPWHKLDPDIKILYDGPESGPGAAYTWDGPEMGTGRMTITAVTPERVETRLDFQAPLEGRARGTFALQPAGPATLVTWRMEGTNGFVSKALALVMDMDAMIGEQFERGLASLKEIAESEASAAPAEAPAG